MDIVLIDNEKYYDKIIPQDINLIKRKIIRSEAITQDEFVRIHDFTQDKLSPLYRENIIFAEIRNLVGDLQSKIVERTMAQLWGPIIKVKLKNPGSEKYDNVVTLRFNR